jgi:hypothetical protein
MMGKRVDENLELDLEIAPPDVEVRGALAPRRPRRIKYRVDRTGWLLLPLALILLVLCALAAVLALSDDPSGGVAGRAFDSFFSSLGLRGPESGDIGATGSGVTGGGFAAMRAARESDMAGGSSPTLSGSSINSSISIKAMLKGFWEGDIYRNQYAGFALTLRAPWERRAEKDNYVAGQEDVVAALAVNPENGDNVLVRFFNLAATSDAQGVYEDDFLMGMRQVADKDVARTVEFSDIFAVDIGDMAYKCMKETVGGDTTMYYLARRIGDYMNIISVKTEGELDDALSMFGKTTRK